MKNITYSPTLSRTVSVRLKVYDSHIHFGENQTEESDVQDYDDQDSSIVDGKVLRVGTQLVADAPKIFYSYDFMGWNQISGGDYPSIGVAGDWLWVYSASDGIIKRCPFSNGSFGSFENIYSMVIGDNVIVAPISATECFFIKVIPNDVDPLLPGRGISFNRLVFSGGIGTVTTWDHHAYLGMDGVVCFDAELIGDVVYLLFQGSTLSYEKNTAYIVRYDQAKDLWFAPEIMIPEDALSFADEIVTPDPNEDGNTFKAKSCFTAKAISKINNVLAVTAEIKRPYGPSLFTLIVGPEPWKMGRDSFIYTDMVPWACCGDYPATFYRKNYFKVHLLGSNLVCTGFNLQVISPAPPPFVSTSSAPNFREITSVISASISDKVNDASVLMMELKNGIVIDPGETIEFYEVINNVDYLIGVFETDIPAKELRTNGIVNGVTARGSAMKALQGWESDTCYDFWSQTMTASRADELGKLIRIKGTWKDDNDVNGNPYATTQTELNADAFMYSPEKSFRYGMADLTFKYLNPTYQSFQGPGLCYYQKSRYDVAQELSTDLVKVKLEDVKETDIGYNGVFLLYGNRPSNSAQKGYWLARLTNNVWTHMDASAFYAVDLGNNVVERAILFFEDGEFRAYRWDDGAQFMFSYFYWPTPTGELESQYCLPWIRNGEGQPCLVNRIISPNSLCYAFDSSQAFIPVVSTTTFPDNGTVRVDEELITYRGKSASTNLGPFDYAEARLVDTTGYPNLADENFAEHRSRNVVLQKIGKAGNITAIEVYVKKYGTPRDLRISIYRAPWTTSKPIGTEVASAVVPASEITTEYALHRVKFTYPVSTDDQCFIALMLNVDPAHPADASGYTFKTVTVTPAPGLWEFNESTDVKTAMSGTLRYAAYSSPTGSSGTYYLCARNVPDGDYSGLCLYTISGSGSDMAFKIIHNNMSNGDMVFEVDQMPYGLDDTTKYQIVPVLYVTERGYNKTVPTSHSKDTMVSADSTPSFQLGDEAKNRIFTAFSSNKNYTVEDMAKEIARKAGVQTISGSKLYSGSTVIPSAGTTPMRRKNFSVKFTGDITDPVGVFISGKDPDTGTLTRIREFYVDPTKMLFVTGSSGATDDAGFPIPTALKSSNEVIMSYYRSYITCWVNNEFVGWFRVPNENTSDMEYYSGLITTASSITIGVDWPEADIIVDNFIMDMGFRGFQLMQMMIKEKRIYFGDGNDGSLRIYASRPVISDAIGLRVQQGKTFSDSNIVTRLRVEGGVIQESIDLDAMRKYGNLFVSKNMEEVFDLSDAKRVSAELLEEFGSRVIYMSIAGAIDPRIEPNDIVVLTSGEEIIVDSISHSININNADIQFDMILEGRCQRKDLPLE